MKVFIDTVVDGSVESVFEAFDEKLFRALKPPLLPLEIERFDGCEPGHEVHLRVGPFKQKWVSLITESHRSSDECYFVDEGKTLPPPLSSWRHRHAIVKESETKVKIIDDVDYFTGNRFVDILLRPLMILQFALRRPVYRKFFSQEKAHDEDRPYRH